MKEASAAYSTYIEEYDLGGGNWSGGELTEDGRPVARVSHHGRVWEMAEDGLFRRKLKPSCLKLPD